MYMDDINIFAKNKTEMQILLQTVRIYNIREMTQTDYIRKKKKQQQKNKKKTKTKKNGGRAGFDSIEDYVDATIRRLEEFIKKAKKD